MPRLTTDQWQSIRAEREATGVSFPELAKRFGVSHQAIQKRAKEEAWGSGEDVAKLIRLKVAERVAGLVATDSQKRKVEAIAAAVDRSAEIIRRHQEETNAIRERLNAGLESHKAAHDKESKALAFDDLKAAKISSECLLNIHKAERQAWALDDRDAQPTVIIERSFGK